MTVTIISGNHVQVNESAGFVEICVEALNASQAAYRIIVNTTQGTATGKETCY